MPTIKDFPVRVIKNGKTRGRPSRQEIAMSKLTSWMIKQPEIRQQIRNATLDALVYGEALTNSFEYDTLKILQPQGNYANKRNKSINF